MTREFTWKEDLPIMKVIHPHEQGNENLNPDEVPFYTY